MKRVGLLALMLAGCDTVERGPIPIAYGQDTCDACRMIISEAPHAAQMRLAEKVEMFDDIGCLIERMSKAAAPIELWVTDQKTGQWIDARSAHFSQSETFKTPMASGIAAFARKSDADAHAARYHGRLHGFEDLRTLAHPH